MAAPKPFGSPRFATTALILVQLPQAGDTGAVSWWRGVRSKTNHIGASSICHLHFSQSTHVLAGGDGPWCWDTGVRLFLASSDMSVSFKSNIRRSAQ